MVSNSQTFNNIKINKINNCLLERDKVHARVRETIQSSLKELLESFGEKSHILDSYDAMKCETESTVSSLVCSYDTVQVESTSSLPQFNCDISFLNLAMFTPGCIVCRLQFKHVYRDYVIPGDLCERHPIKLGDMLITRSHLDPLYSDLGVVTSLFTVDQFLAFKKLLGRSVDEEENFVGVALRLATEEERRYLPIKLETEKNVHHYARYIVVELELIMDVYEVEFQFDGKVLYVYYTADNRVDYRQFVAYMKAFTGVRVKMKKTNQCRKFVPRLFASVALATGKLP